MLNEEKLKEIEYKPHPKYKAMRQLLLDKIEMLSDKQQTEVSEKIAREERLRK